MQGICKIVCLFQNREVRGRTKYRFRYILHTYYLHRLFAFISFTETRSQVWERDLSISGGILKSCGQGDVMSHIIWRCAFILHLMWVIIIITNAVSDLKVLDQINFLTTRLISTFIYIYLYFLYNVLFSSINAICSPLQTTFKWCTFVARKRRNLVV